MIEEYGVTIFYTAPPPSAPSSRRAIISSTARPLAAPARLGRRADQPGGMDVVSQNIGGGRCPIVDTWWQTETGAIMISPLPGATPTKPGTATLPFFGIDAAILDETGNDVAEPGRQARDPQAVAVDAAHDLRRQGALQKTYWSDFPGIYTAGRRRAPRQGRQFLDRRPPRRRAQCFRPPPRHRRNRKRAGFPPGRGRGRGGRPPGRHQGPGVVAFVTLKAVHRIRRSSRARNCATTSAR
jgi:hypothetical protein